MKNLITVFMLATLMVTTACSKNASSYAGTYRMDYKDGHSILILNSDGTGTEEIFLNEKGKKQKDTFTYELIKIKDGKLSLPSETVKVGPQVIAVKSPSREVTYHLDPMSDGSLKIIENAYFRGDFYKKLP